MAKAGGVSLPNLTADFSSKLASTFEVKSIDRKKQRGNLLYEDVKIGGDVGVDFGGGGNLGVCLTQ